MRPIRDISVFLPGAHWTLFDAGIRRPPGAFSTAAHAGCLAFEMSSSVNRLIVNCGMAVGSDDAWAANALRSTAAHSTLMIDDVLGNGAGRG